jgi:hypothetical protein
VDKVDMAVAVATITEIGLNSNITLFSTKDQRKLSKTGGFSKRINVKNLPEVLNQDLKGEMQP